jgi:hypothetical protein
LIDLARGTLEGTAFAVIEIFARALSLSVIAASIVIARAIPNRWVNYLALAVFILGGLNLVGLATGVSLATRWNLLLEFEATDRRIFFLILLSMFGVIVGLARYVLTWMETLPETVPAQDMLAPTPPPESISGRIRFRVRAVWLSWRARAGERVPAPVRHTARGVTEHWRALFAAVLLCVLGGFVLWYSVSPNVWLQRALFTAGQLAFLR